MKMMTKMSKRLTWWYSLPLEERRKRTAIYNATARSRKLAWQRAHPDKRVTILKKYYQSHTDKIMQAHRTAIARDPHKRKARNAVNNALRDGKLKRGPCEVCGSKKVTAHHEDYSKPLQVRWLCPLHHAAEHRKYKD